MVILLRSQKPDLDQTNTSIHTSPYRNFILPTMCPNHVEDLRENVANIEGEIITVGVIKSTPSVSSHASSASSFIANEPPVEAKGGDAQHSTRLKAPYAIN